MLFLIIPIIIALIFSYKTKNDFHLLIGITAGIVLTVVSGIFVPTEVITYDILETTFLNGQFSPMIADADGNLHAITEETKILVDKNIAIPYIEVEEPKYSFWLIGSIKSLELSQ